METLLNSLLSVAGVVLLGWIAGRSKIIKEENDRGFNVFILNFSLPILLFIATATAKSHELLDLRMGGAFVVALMGMYFLTFALNRIVFKRSLQRSAETAFVCGYPNTAFLGIPLLTSLIGMQAMLPIVVSNIVVGVLMIPTTLILIELGIVGESGVDLKQITLRVIKNPLIFMPILGIIISSFQLPVPKVIASSATLIGGTTSGISLFTLGLIISRFKIHLSTIVVVNIFLKNIIHPLLMMGIVKIFGISGLLAKELVILCAMPTAITSTIFSVSFDIDPQENVSSTIIGTIMSLLTLFIFMYWLHF
ncbi:MAG: AEC family transporter [Burkholderiales bacterium]|jgi:predicted permease|nr:AEC family transporter [Burkholderiales bacterium]MBP9769612.1 AEC family transporter [Burkholderiales bacterium]